MWKSVHKKEWFFSPPPSVTGMIQGQHRPWEKDASTLSFSGHVLVLEASWVSFSCVCFQFWQTIRSLRLTAFLVENVTKQWWRVTEHSLLEVLEWLVTKAPRCPLTYPAPLSPILPRHSSFSKETVDLSTGLKFKTHRLKKKKKEAWVGLSRVSVNSWMNRNTYLQRTWAVFSVLSCFGMCVCLCERVSCPFHLLWKGNFSCHPPLQ